MFRFLKARRARSIIEQISVDLDKGLLVLPPAERSAALAIANSMMIASAEEHGDAVLRNPRGLPVDAVAQMVFDLAEVHQSILKDVLIPLERRGMEDVSYAQGMRHLRAIEVVMTTVGSAIVPEAYPRAVAAWKVLWRARQHNRDAVALLGQYAKHTRTAPVARIKGGVDAKRLTALAASVPPFLKVKRRPTTRAAAKVS